MKRRLDLALALVSNPRVLFLDEPTTGLDPQSRTALWEEVARLAREDGVTVFLTTQYLEEADVLADRVGIIDQRPHRRRGHAGRAEGRDRRARRSRSCRARRTIASRCRACSTASAPATQAGPNARRACSSTTAPPRSPTSSARSTPRASRSPTCSCTRRRSTTCSWPRPAATSRARPTGAARPTRRRPGGGPGVSAVAAPLPAGLSSSRAWDAGRRARAALDRAHGAPAGDGLLRLRLPALPAGRELRRPARRRRRSPASRRTTT